MNKLFLSVCLFCSLSLYGQQREGSDILTVTQMHEDIDFYFKTIRDVSPNIYVRYSPQQIDSLQGRIKEWADVPMRALDFKYILARANKYLGEHDGIRGLRPANALIPGMDVKDGRLYFRDNPVVRVNGVASVTLENTLGGLVSWNVSDAYRDVMMRIFMDASFMVSNKVEAPYKVEYLDKSSGRIMDTVLDRVVYNSIFNEERLKILVPSFDTTYHVKPMNMRFFPEESIAVLFYNTSDSGKEKEIRSAADEFFAAVASGNYKYVFIDVSQNGGGSDGMHWNIMKHLKSEPYALDGWSEVTLAGADIYRQDKIPNQRRLKAAAEGGIAWDYSSRGNRDGYEGKVFVITGPETFSAAYDFSQDIRLGKAALIVGEVSGQRFPFSGEGKTFNLPNSRIPFRVATHYLTLKNNPATDGEGLLQPDIPYALDHVFGVEDYKKIIELSGK